MPYAAVLDADVLFGGLTADLLLTIAERGLYRPIWSGDILDELERNLARRIGQTDARERVATMRSVFPEAMCPAVARYRSAVPDAVDEDDRHVVAAAIASQADGIVTRNLRHFPADALASIGLEAQSLDHFLVNQWHLDEHVVVASLTEMSDRFRRPPLAPEEIVDRLQAIAPQFAALARGSFAPR